MNTDQTAPMGPYCLQSRLKFCPENVCFFLRLLHIQKHFRLLLIMEANTTDPDQTAPKEQSDQGLYCLQCILSKCNCMSR